MKKIAGAACLAFIAVAARAQTQVATVTSSAPFSLRGAGITPGQGVPMWPVLAGDDVKAGNTMTIVTFPDGSVVTLAPGSEGKIDLVNGKPEFQLLSGTARYSLKSTTAVQLMEAQPDGHADGLAGHADIGWKQSGCGRTGRGRILDGGAHCCGGRCGGGTAAGLGFAVSDAVRGGSPVSPSQ